MVIKKNTPGCSTDAECRCDGDCGCSGATATSYRITLSGWADNGDCQGCADLVGSYILTASGNPCEWNYSLIGSQPCRSSGVVVMALTIEDSGGATKATIQIGYSAPFGFGSHWIKYSKTFSGAVDCTAWSDEAIPYQSQGSDHPTEDRCDYDDEYGGIDDCLLSSIT
jgi:hypothetical protein